MGVGERPGARVNRPPQRSASNLLSCPILIGKDPHGSIRLLCKTSSCRLETALGEQWWETRHPWEQRCPGGGPKRREETQALLQVINHFIVSCVLGQGAGPPGERMCHRNAIAFN